MRLATYNVEWFDALFDDRGRLAADLRPSRRWGVSRAEQSRALGVVFRALDADAVLVVEAPDTGGRRRTVAALEHFASVNEVRARRAAIGFANETQQEIALMYDPDRLRARHAPRAGSGGIPRFDGRYRMDHLQSPAFGDAVRQVRFSKPPLEVDIETAAGRRLHLIGVHLKSKAPHGAKTDADIRRVGLENRRKQLGQAIWLRARIDQHLEEGTSLVVMGDLNDGPGLDDFEGFLGRSSVEIVLGAEGPMRLHDPNAERALPSRFGAAPTSARFWIEPEQRYLEALLDYVMLSEPLMAAAPEWRIWHPFDDPECWANEDLRDALVAASDHFPVTVDLDI